MDVLFIHRSDFSGGGGGAIAMHRLREALREEGVSSKVLSSIKSLNSPDTIQIKRSRSAAFLEPRLKRAAQHFGLNDIHAYSAFSVPRHPAFQKADIVNIHGIHGGFFSYLALPRLTSDKPVIFTLHDMWAYTGHCAYSYDCERWKSGCGQCPYPQNHPPIQRDNTQLEWKLKKRVYERSNLVIVTLSTVQTEQARQSILGHFPIHMIPNGVDTEVFQPLDPAQCRTALGLPAGKKVLMFSALNLNQFNKGGDLLVQALIDLPPSLKSNLVLLTLGTGGEEVGRAVDIPIFPLGYVSGDRLKAIAYSAADVFISPTRAESFGLVALESMACGTPTVAFGVGGILDLVRPDETGYLAQPESAQDLGRGVVQLLENPATLELMGVNGRTMACEEYSLALQARRYIDVCQHYLNDDGN